MVDLVASNNQHNIADVNLRKEANLESLKTATLDSLAETLCERTQLRWHSVGIDLHYVRYIQFSHTLTSLLHYLQDR
ncbi:hypothetical protein [Chamaesiphon sp.]|uniref:hypothetical protein n=1 Tax=Chamaesiphon sp. TaxID=2814140 RepID=UPI003593A6D0